MFAHVGSRRPRERHAREEGTSVYRFEAATGQLDLVMPAGGKS